MRLIRLLTTPRDEAERLLKLAFYVIVMFEESIEFERLRKSHGLHWYNIKHVSRAGHENS